VVDQAVLPQVLVDRTQLLAVVVAEVVTYYKQVSLSLLKITLL
jgi:hypothetical protein